MSETKTSKPGQTLITIGLLIAVVGGLFIGAVISGGGNGGMIWIPLVGLILAGIGFAQRVLAALENKSTARD